MSSALKILVCVVLSFATTVNANQRSRNQGWIDLGTSIQPRWEIWNNGGLGNKIYRTVPTSGTPGVRNVGYEYLNGRNDQQQEKQLTNLAQQNRAQADLNSVLIGDSEQQYSNGRTGPNGLPEQDGYAGLGLYRTLNPNPSIDYVQILSGKAGQRQSQYLDQARIYQQKNFFDNAASNEQLNKIVPLGSQLYRNINQEQRSGDSERLNQYDSKSGLSESNVGQKNYLRYSSEQLGQPGIQLDQDILINSGRLIPSNKLRQSTRQSNDELNGKYVVRDNRGLVAQENNQQSNADSTQELINRNNARNQYQLLRSLKNQQLNRPAQVPIARGPVPGNINGQYPLNGRWNLRWPSAQINGDVQNGQQFEANNSNLGTNSDSIAAQQNQQGVNQQQPNVYTYSELNAKIWNVIKSNPSMISNLENLREQLLSGVDSGNEQMNQLKSLLQEARKYNRENPIQGSSIVGQSPEEQERNAVVTNLINTMDKNRIISNPLDIRGLNWYGRW